jgi:hypothetical protein
LYYAMYPAANVTGTWMMWSLRAQKYVTRRSVWKRLVVLTLELVILKMNELAGNVRVLEIWR